jgi:MFS family permease
VVQRESIGFGLIARTLIREYPSRAAVGFTLNASQAFLYNAIFFTYALVLTSFYDVAEGKVGYYLLPFAAGNFLGPLLLGPLFDRIGRRVMISLSYAAAGVLLLITGLLFQQEALSATSQTICWSVIFFFASAAGSSALLGSIPSKHVRYDLTMVRLVAVAIALIVGATAALLWWIATHPASSTDGLAFIFLPLYALAAMFGVLILVFCVYALRSGRRFLRDQRRI